MSRRGLPSGTAVSGRGGRGRLAFGVGWKGLWGVPLFSSCQELPCELMAKDCPCLPAGVAPDARQGPTPDHASRPLTAQERLN
ncbi:hypothetical protein LSM04_007905 [Trypanosoma melophagium]|uniref:uncharacterized protein n=1 Tax=Trypanosoma melophagium TaxID=715481 RepID=UPI00351A7133|nr:hypothetical protein LSM04_007905 [Trypanosoma melophagium]